MSLTWAKLWASILSLINKAIPAFAFLLGRISGKNAKQAEIDKRNLEKKVEYVEIRADKSGNIDDDLDRMQGGTY